MYGTIVGNNRVPNGLADVLNVRSLTVLGVGISGLQHTLNVTISSRPATRP